MGCIVLEFLILLVIFDLLNLIVYLNFIGEVVHT
jgi:hypothetical protein